VNQTDMSRWRKAAELLELVLDLPVDEQDRAAVELGSEHGVREELASLLRSSRKSSVLDGPLEKALDQVPAPVLEYNVFRGARFGNWKLGDQIGHGGMSAVYHASRISQDFEQHAALKVLSAGHLGKDFVESFIRERQILSDLQHAGIARLIDGGLSPDGAPYLVMQYVEGDKIDDWCRRRRADPRTIVRMILKLCGAVAYAHSHLVVHQDIKPGNVLVDEHDRPILIDFGIARLLEASTGDKGLHAFTPHYAAPELVAGGQITTATDVYSIGMLMREMISGQKIDDDLNAILHMATSEDPEQRYVNARILSEDLQTWLDKRPVRARPATPSYRLNRFVARYRWRVVAAMLVILSLLAGLGTALWQARIASFERDVARVEGERALQVTDFLKDLFRASDPDRARGEAITARELLDQGAHRVESSFQETPRLKAEMLVLLGDLYRELGELDTARPLLEQALSQADEIDDFDLRVDSRRALALLRMEAGEHEQALALASEGEALLQLAGMVPGEQHSSLMRPILFSLAELGRVPEAVARGEEMLARVRQQPVLPVGAFYKYLNDTANVLLIAEQPDKAQAMLLEATELNLDESADPSTQMSLYTNLAGIQLRQGQLESAIGNYRKALALAEEIYPPGHSGRARMLSNLGGGLASFGNYQEAESIMREALAIYEELYGETANPRVAAAHNNLGRVLQQAGLYEVAEPHLTRARDLAGELFGKNDPRYAVATGNLGSLYRLSGDYEQAEVLLQENLSLRLSILGPQHRSVGNAISLLAALRLEQDRAAEALDMCDEALALFERIEYRNPRAVLITQTRRARALAMLERTGEARAAFSDAMQAGEKVAGDLGTVWPELLAAHAEFLVETGDAGAGAALKHTLDAHHDVFGETHPATRHIAALLDNWNARAPL